MLGKESYMTHGFKPAPYCTLVYAVFLCKLSERLFPFDIFGFQLLFIEPFAADKLLAAGLAFI